MNPFDKAWDVLKMDPQDRGAPMPGMPSRDPVDPYGNPYNPLDQGLPDSVSNRGMRQTLLSEFDPKMGDMRNMPKEPEPEINSPAWWKQYNDQRRGEHIQPPPPPMPQSGQMPPPRAPQQASYTKPQGMPQGPSPSSPSPPPSVLPNMDPSWTPEAIARINAQNDESRRALRGEE